MSLSALANRYAKALSDITFASNEVTEVFDEISTFCSLLKENSELQEIVSNPTISQTQKESVLTSLILHMKLRQTTANFLNLLLRNQRLPYLDIIVQAFSKEIDKRLGIISTQITTAETITPEQQQAFFSELKKITGKEVKANFKINPDLIGGAVIHIGSKVYDGSIRSQLNSLKKQLCN